MGTGKTTRANELCSEFESKQLPVINIDYDLVANDVVAELFGITTPPERQALANQLFGDKSKLAQFEAVVHPQTYQKVAKIVQDFYNENQSADIETIQIIHQIPLYNRTKSLFTEHFGDPDEVINLSASDDEIIRRLTSSRNITKGQIVARLNNQRDV